MKLRWSVLLLSGALLFGCGQSQSDNPAFKPVLNPNPKYFVTYKGFIDPSLHHVVKLTFLTVYQTTNPKCNKVINEFEGVSAPREKLDYIYVKPDKKGYYQYRTPIDKYIKGYCGWQINSIHYSKKQNAPRYKYMIADIFTNKNKIGKNIKRKNKLAM